LDQGNNKIRAMDSIERAARVIHAADAFLVAAGAGMGVDSGMPDFRSDGGFWRTYPVFADRGLHFEDLASPRWFAEDPAVAWGFYGHRQALYDATTPHAGFGILKGWCDRATGGWFVYTSNVDGHFQRAGFDEDRVVECHGNIFKLQCRAPCHEALWPAAPPWPDVDPETVRATGELPRCPECGEIARPNILMFGDADWVPREKRRRVAAMERWLDGRGYDRLAVIELGAGTHVVTVRTRAEITAIDYGAEHVRINPREPEGGRGAIGIALPALEALTRIDERVRELDGEGAGG
jgi:NAD-dependent SIR2 family protein deacetylase